MRLSLPQQGTFQKMPGATNQGHLEAFFLHMGPYISLLPIPTGS